jgi:hypothetical protein
MEVFLRFTNENPWLNVVFILLALISIFISFWLYFKGKKTKKPTYCTHTINLIRESINKIKSLDIQHKGQKINNLSVTKLALWNAGKETINSIDIAQNDKFRIEINDKYEIIDCELVFQKNQANGFKIENNNMIIDITFDYFDHNEGVILYIYHTAPHGYFLELKGAFKGVNTIVRKSNRIFSDSITKILYSILKPNLTRKILGIVTFLLPFFFIVLLIKDYDRVVKNNYSYIFMIVTLGLVMIYWWLSYKILKRKVPKGFDLFESQF